MIKSEKVPRSEWNPTRSNCRIVRNREVADGRSVGNRKVVLIQKERKRENPSLWGNYKGDVSDKQTQGIRG